MGRYDIIKKKNSPPKKFKDPSQGDGISKDISEYQSGLNPEDYVTTVQTPISGQSLMIRGPNGFQVNIPLRFVRIIETDRNGDYELTLRVTPSVGRGLVNDIRGEEATQQEDQEFDSRDRPLPSTRMRGIRLR